MPLALDVLAFARAALPEPPARVLEIGAGRGELTAALREQGYTVVGIDPAAEPDTGIEQIPLLDVEGEFEAAVAVVSLHHVEPLDQSFNHLATLVRPGAPLVIDEFDVGRYDERAASWWLAQRAALGAEEEHHAQHLVTELRDHIHPLPRIRAALAPHFELGEPVPGPYLHRWDLLPELRDAEEALIAAGKLPATGARIVGFRR